MSASAVAIAERVAKARVVVGELAVQEDAGEDRDDEVERAVEVVREDDQRAEVQRPLLDRLLVVDAEVVLERDDLCFAWSNACGGAGAPAVDVPDRRVHDVEHEDREDLDPPVEDVPVAQAAAAAELAMSARLRCSHGRSDARLVACAASAARPRTPALRACSRRVMHPHHSSPAATAWPLLTPNECRNSTSAPSRTPRPLNEIGSTCSISDRGHEREHGRRSGPGGRARGRCSANISEHARSGTRCAVPSTGTICRGSRRSRSTPTCTAPMNAVQFSCSANRPAMRRVAGEHEHHGEQRERDARDRAARSTRGGRRSATAGSTKPRNTSNGSATKPVSRSSTTDANDDLGRADGVRRPRDAQTSPPIVDGRTLPTNRPAR